MPSKPNGRMNVSRLVGVRVVSASQIESMRQIRNATAAGFSHDTSLITPQQQQRWWSDNRSRIKAWLYYHQATLIGYGMLRQDDLGQWWNSLGVLPEQQGHGFGSQITADLLSRISGPVYASVKRDNWPAIAMHHASDWQQIEGPDERLMYFRSREYQPPS